jgi:hypothetical protein
MHRTDCRARVISRLDALGDGAAGVVTGVKLRDRLLAVALPDLAIRILGVGEVVEPSVASR